MTGDLYLNVIPPFGLFHAPSVFSILPPAPLSVSLPLYNFPLGCAFLFLFGFRQFDNLILDQFSSSSVSPPAITPTELLLKYFSV